MTGAAQAFNDWMNGDGPLVVIGAALAYGLLGPVFVLVHELGHASVCLARTRGRVRVRVGSQPGRWQFQVGRLDLSLSPTIPFRSGIGGDATPLTRLDHRTRIAFVVAGPLASAVFAALVLGAGIWARQLFVIALGGMAVLHVAHAAVPRRADRRPNDGNALLRAVRSPKALDEWAKLFADVKGTLGPERGRVVNAVPVLVEHPGTGPDALGVWKLAFAGWCWRAISGDGWEDMRDAALVAVDSATRTGAVDPDLTIIASRELAGRESSAGFEHMPAGLRSIPVDEAKQRWAFQFGIALYDIEMARNASSVS